MFDILLKSLSSHNKSILQSLGRKLGLEIRLSGPSSRDDLRLTRMLMQNGIDLVIDVGANRGQFAASIFTAGYKGGVVSFEPLPVVHELLSGLARNFGPRWTVAPRLALSDSDGITMFNVNRSDVTSSLLPSLDAVGDGGATFQQIEVETRRLDCFIDELGLNKRRWFLKIDVQGGEKLVLAGATASLGLASGLIVELSTTQLYAGQPLAFDILAQLMQLGFEVHDVMPGYREPSSFKLFQFDAVLFHPDRIADSHKSLE